MPFNCVAISLSVLTHVVDDETLSFPKDQAGRVWVEGDGEVRGRGGHFKRADSPNKLSQYTCCDLISIQKG